MRRAIRPPIPVCRTSDLPEAGAFWTLDAPEAPETPDALAAPSTPVLVARDTAGNIRAMVNLCRHRGTRLVYEARGVTKTFTCILHGWVYDLEGNMGGTPLAKLAEKDPQLAAIRQTSALVPLPSATHHGFVWVVPSPRAAVDIPAHLGPLDATFATMGLDQYVVYRREPRVVRLASLANVFRAHLADSVHDDDREDGEASDAGQPVAPIPTTVSERSPAYESHAVHVLSEDTVIVVHTRAVSILTCAHRPSENDGLFDHDPNAGSMGGHDDTHDPADALDPSDPDPAPVQSLEGREAVVHHLLLTERDPVDETEESAWESAWTWVERIVH